MKQLAKSTKSCTVTGVTTEKTVFQTYIKPGDFNINDILRLNFLTDATAMTGGTIFRVYAGGVKFLESFSADQSTKIWNFTLVNYNSYTDQYAIGYCNFKTYTQCANEVFGNFDSQQGFDFKITVENSNVADIQVFRYVTVNVE